MVSSPRLSAILLIGGLVVFLTESYINNSNIKHRFEAPQFKVWRNTIIGDKQFIRNQLTYGANKENRVSSTMTHRSKEKKLQNNHNATNIINVELKSIFTQIQNGSKEAHNNDKTSQQKSSHERGNDDGNNKQDELQNVTQGSQTTHRYTQDQIRSRYLLPLVIYGHQGPNSIYHSYRFAINYAMNQGRSVVQIPFRSKTGVMKRFNETFDVEKLSQLLPVKTMDDFRRDCGEILSFESLVNLQIPSVYDRSQKQPELRKEGVIPYIRNDPSIHENVLGINLPIIPDRGISSFESVMHYYSSENIPCIVVLLMDGKSILKLDVNAVSHYKTIDKYLTRAPYIRQMADKVVKQFCNGDSFVALHWRNMGAEGCPGECEPVKLLNKHLPELASLVYKYINARGIKCLYIAAPGSAQNFVDELKKTPLTVYNQNVLKNDMPALSKDLKVFIEDSGYKLSLLEQEIAISSKLFIKCRWSTWSDLVLYARDAQRKETIDFTDIPGLPAELLNRARLIKRKK